MVDFQKKYNVLLSFFYTNESTWFGLEDDSDSTNKTQIESDTDSTTEKNYSSCKKKRAEWDKRNIASRHFFGS